MTDHIIKTFKIGLPPSVLAYHLLKNSNILTEQQELTRATITESTTSYKGWTNLCFGKLYIKNTSHHCCLPNGQYNRGKGYQGGNQWKKTKNWSQSAIYVILFIAGGEIVLRRLESLLNYPEIQRCYAEQFVSETMDSELLSSWCVAKCYLDTQNNNITCHVLINIILAMAM